MLSFSIDWSGIYTNANQIIGPLLQVMLIPIGILIGFALVRWIASAIKSAFSLGK